MQSTSTTANPVVKPKFHWIFPAEKFNDTPSRRDNMSSDEELNHRQQAAVFIYELGTNLKVPHYCINTAVVYMHRFYMVHSFKQFTKQKDNVQHELDIREGIARHTVSAACLFLACKVEEFPRTLRDLIENTGKVLRKKKAEEMTQEMIAQYTDDIVNHENVLLSTLGQIQSLPEKTPRELAQTAYYLATKSILLTSFCVKYPPDLIACFCIHLAAAWVTIQIPSSSENKQWFQLVNELFTEKQLSDLSEEFLHIYEKCPEKIKKKLVYQNERQPQSGSTSSGGQSTSGHNRLMMFPPPQGPGRPMDMADSVVPQRPLSAQTYKEHRNNIKASTALPSQTQVQIPSSTQPVALKQETVKQEHPSAPSNQQRPPFQQTLVKRESLPTQQQNTHNSSRPPAPTFSSSSQHSATMPSVKQEQVNDRRSSQASLIPPDQRNRPSQPQPSSRGLPPHIQQQTRPYPQQSTVTPNFQHPRQLAPTHPYNYPQQQQQPQQQQGYPPPAASNRHELQQYQHRQDPNRTMAQPQQQRTSSRPTQPPPSSMGQGGDRKSTMNARPTSQQNFDHSRQEQGLSSSGPFASSSSRQPYTGISHHPQPSQTMGVHPSGMTVHLTNSSTHSTMPPSVQRNPYPQPTKRPYENPSSSSFDHNNAAKRSRPATNVPPNLHH
ncbi:unnamed protein product [Didymodactylos carnosus]|uniref:Cyclin-like domain-containing protein n=1 Tax=Didymodactylos carnosus TaxID=1234261 RepID=A0A8S2DUH8_9BILA|nr:unnamed protein product [Didymodactylos carnosus]CAF3755104.1 unnamed protein product [Didymodactylos carnosus]